MILLVYVAFICLLSRFVKFEHRLITRVVFILNVQTSSTKQTVKTSTVKTCTVKTQKNKINESINSYSQLIVIPYSLGELGQNLLVSN